MNIDMKILQKKDLISSFKSAFYFRIPLVLLLFLVLSHASLAQVKLPKFISDNLVLQYDAEHVIKGWAASNEKVKLHFKDKVFETKANSSGEWEIKLPPQKYGGPYSMKFEASNIVEVKNILFGDVYLCSGQSNMELPMSRLADNYPDEMNTADNPNIRQFLVPDKFEFQDTLEDFGSGSWKEANQKNLPDFSGVAYFFAKSIYKEKGIPIGLINSALGGSPVSAWMDSETLKEFPELYKEHLKWRDQALIDSVTTSEQKASDRWYGELNKKDSGLEHEWFKYSKDKSSWNSMTIPGLISDVEFKGQAGVVWFSKEVFLENTPISKTSKLNLGRLVDADQVYINGEKIGATTYQYPPRKYEFESKILNKNKNEIVVRLINNGGESGFVKDKDYELIVDNDTIDVSGEWKYKSAARMPNTPRTTFIRWKSGGLYNAMIAPLTDFKLKGVLWYQGESDTGNPELYSKTFPRLIESWRNHWSQPNLPFLFVQLTNFMQETTGPQESHWAELREVQRRVNKTIPNTGMAVTIDIGEWNDIHPLNKKDVGERLALEARRVVYKENLTTFGPAPKNVQLMDNSIVIEFENVDSGWKFDSGNSPKGFSVSEDGKVFYHANAEIYKSNSIKVHSQKVNNPKYLRYAWANNPGDANVFNKEGLPSVPFEIKIKNN